MATVCHIIHSQNAPLAVQHSTIHADEGIEVPDPWQTESSDFGLNPRLKPPSFVPAKLSFDDWGARKSYTNAPAPDQLRGKDLAAWYSEVTTTSTASSSRVRLDDPVPAPPQLPRKEKKTKNNWFIQNVIVPTNAAPAPSLADILERNPPPLESTFTPPTWLTIGPSNRGFNLLERQGWNEGEGLGPGIARRPQVILHPHSRPTNVVVVKKEEPEMREVEVQWSDDIQEIRKVDVIDLTEEDDDDDEPLEDDELDQLASQIRPSMQQPPTTVSYDPYAPKALLTPIAVVLKSDRLGLGLKAKTEGPYKSSQKRVTHGAAAIASHLKAAEEVRRRKKETGRGTRGFAKQNKREAEKRKHMLALLNE